MKRKPSTAAFFYRNHNTVTKVSSSSSTTIFGTDSRPLGQKTSETSEAKLLLVDDKNSIYSASEVNNIATQYSPYGHATNLPFLLGYNGELAQNHASIYMLGNGYRVYMPQLMRFISPDGKSPFGRGGVNAYAYCSNDPINYTDPSGQARNPLRTPVALTLTKSRRVVNGKLYRVENIQGNKRFVPAPALSESEKIHLKGFIDEQTGEIDRTRARINQIKHSHGRPIQEAENLEAIIDKGNASRKTYTDALNWTKDRRAVKNTIADIESRISEARTKLTDITTKHSAHLEKYRTYNEHHKQLTSDLENANAILRASS